MGQLLKVNNHFTKDSTWKRLRKIFKRDKYLYIMISLPLVFYILFHYYPMYGLVLAFKNFNIRKGIMGSDWAGMKYVNMFIKDPYFWRVFKNTIVLNIFSILWGFPMPIILALMLNELNSEKYKKTVQSISYLPHFISTVVVVGMLVTLFAGDGVVNNALGKVNIGPFQFLLQPQYFRTIYIASNIWQNIGWGSIIYLAALSNVNPQLYEAATMDGAGRLRQLIHITLPCIAPTISIMFILQMGRIMSTSFQKILLLMNGTNMVVSDVIATYVYRRGILGAEFSYSTAVGMFESVVAVIFVVGTNALSKKFSETSLW